MLPSADERILHTKNLYERILLARLVDEYIYQLHILDKGSAFTSCRGYEAAQIGTALCIEVGKDFTLPHYRDLGVIMTIGMSPYEVFRTYLQNSTHEKQDSSQVRWSYQKHNTVTSSMTVATQILHAAGIAFASKLRKIPVVTIAYCSEDIVQEADFLEGISFSAHHQLPIVFVCEHNITETTADSCFENYTLPQNLLHRRIQGNDVVEVYETMRCLLNDVRANSGPVLLEIMVSPLPFPHTTEKTEDTETSHNDPLLKCKQRLQSQGEWDEVLATQLQQRLLTEVEQALHDALRDVHESRDVAHPQHLQLTHPAYHES